MAKLEGEALLIGIWKNVEELEEFLTLDELDVIVRAAHDKEHRHNRFMAAIKGINIDESGQEDAKEKFERANRNAQARLSGKTAEEIEFADFGLDIEIE